MSYPDKTSEGSFEGLSIVDHVEYNDRGRVEQVHYTDEFNQLAENVTLGALAVMFGGLAVAAVYLAVTFFPPMAIGLMALFGAIAVGSMGLISRLAAEGDEVVYEEEMEEDTEG